MKQLSSVTTNCSDGGGINKISKNLRQVNLLDFYIEIMTFSMFAIMSLSHHLSGLSVTSHKIIRLEY